MDRTIGGQATAIDLDLVPDGRNTGLDCECAVLFVGSKIRKIEHCPLHAAAPEWLAALEVLADHAQETYPHFEGTRGQRDIQAALDAIAKARGES